MLVLDLVVRWLHVLAAVALAGGGVFQLCAYLPALGCLAGEQKEAFLAAVRGSWAKLVAASSGVLLLTGLYNAAMISMKYDLPPYYHALLGVKVVVPLIVFFLAARLAGRSEGAARMRAAGTKWPAITVALGIVVILAGGAMRIIRDQPGLAPLKDRPAAVAPAGE